MIIRYILEINLINYMNAIEIKDLIKTYPPGIKALEGISFIVEKGDFFALLGPNGAGKSTTINIICSLVNKSAGQVKVMDFDLDKDDLKIKSLIGLVPQEFNFNIFEKVIDIVVTQAGYYGIGRRQAEEKAEKLLRKLGLWEKKDSVAQKLSGGMKRKLMIARGLVHEPEILILDEPTAGVDVETRREMWDFIKELNEQGKTIILTTHYLEEAEQLCRRIAIINNGRLIENTSIKDFLNKSDEETFVLDIADQVGSLPKVDFPLKRINSTTLEIKIAKKDSVNYPIKILDQAGIKILSLRNKTNRLEELFIKLTKKE